MNAGIGIHTVCEKGHSDFIHAGDVFRSWCFTHFTSENCGLSFDNVNAITQDSNGFVWVSTEDGLNRFDGSGFIAYYREQLGLNTDFITALCPDNEGNVWIGTDAGATFYSYADDSFHPLDKLSDNE